MSRHDRRDFLAKIVAVAVTVAAAPILPLVPSPALPPFRPDAFVVGDVVTFGTSPRQFVVTCVGASGLTASFSPRRRRRT